MGLFPDHVIESVRSALQADAVLRRINYRPEMIQDTGATLKCFCPIHKETIFRTLVVEKSPAQYRCSNYNCPGKVGGDLIDLYARALGIGYEQALLDLAGHAGIEVDLSSADEFITQSLEVARNYVELGALAEAEEHFDRILQFKPACLPALRGLLRVYELTDRPDDYRAARLRLARALEAEGTIEEAIELLQAHAREVRADAPTRNYYVDVLIGARRDGDAATELVALAQDLARGGEIEQALAAYRRVEAMGLVEIDTSKPIVELLLSAGRRDEAIAQWLAVAARHEAEPAEAHLAASAMESALELDPANEELIVRLAEKVASERLAGNHVARTCARIAGLLASRGHGPAGRALEVLLSAFPNETALIALRADLEEARGNDTAALDLRLQCADAFQQNSQLDAALEVLERTITSHTGKADNVALLSRKANLLRELGRAGDSVPIYESIVDLFRGADEHEHAAAVLQTIIDLEPDRLEHREHQLDLYLKLGIEPVIVQKAIALAQAYEERGKLNEAAALLSRAAERAPRSVELIARESDILERAGRRGEAAEQFLTAGRMMLEQQSYDHARLMIERALKNVPEHLVAREVQADVLVAQGMTLQAMGIYSDLGEFYLREGEAAATVRIAKKILNMQPEHLPTLLMLVKAHDKLGEVDKRLAVQSRLVQNYLKGQSYTRATELCEEILSGNEEYTPALEQLVAIAESTKQSTQSLRYLWKLSQVHARANRRDMEQGILEQIVARDPLHLGAAFRQFELMLGNATPRVLSIAIEAFADRFQTAGQGEDAVQLLNDLVLQSGQRPEILGGLTRLHRARGDIENLKSALRMQAELLGKAMRDDEALAVWGELQSLQPDDATIARTRIEIMLRNAMEREAGDELRRLAGTLAERGRNDGAEGALLEALGLNPRDSAARDALITLFIKTGNTARAAEQIDDAASRLMEEGQLAEALAIYERTFEFDPQRDETYRRMIAVRRRMGDAEGVNQTYVRLLDCLEAKQAMAEFEHAAQEAIALQPANAALRRRLAELLLGQRRVGEAESQLLALAMTQIAAQQLEDADTTLQRILEINPASVPARAHRAELMARRGDASEALKEFLQLTGSLAAAKLAPGGAALTGIGGASAIVGIGGMNGFSGGGDGSMAFAGGNYEGIRLIKDYTFANFTVGARNNFAYATALAVSKAPGKNNNPLFLYSDVGLGKTHLCHAIAHAVADRHPEMKLIYTTTEDFVAELIDAIQNNQITPFRNRHKLADVIIIDDVQFLSGKERAQEEFFNIFNSLYQAGRQVILTSDRPPRDISHLEKRLKSRFGAGVIVDIQSPDLETRVAILKNELAARGKQGAITDDVLTYVAETLESNVRELKGALNQLLARQDFAGGKVDLVLARAVLSQTLTNA